MRFYLRGGALLRGWLGLSLIALVVIAFYLIGGLAIWKSLSSLDQRGQFGDMFGAVNALFAGLAFAGVIWALVLQQRELALQREEIRLSRGEMAAAREVSQAQERRMEEQCQIAIHSSLASQVLALCRLRSEMIVTFFHTTNNKQRDAIRRRLDKSAFAIAVLLNDARWDPTERAAFAILAGADPESVGRGCERVDEEWLRIQHGAEPA